MGTSREITERQHQNAQRLLKAKCGALAEAGVKEQAFKRNTLWRKLDANVRQLSARLRKISELEALDAELKQRKTASADEE